MRLIMAPDINTLPALRSPTLPTAPLQLHAHRQPSDSAARGFDMNAPSSPRSPQSSSLQTVAAINAGFQTTSSSHRSSASESRRRSSLAANLALNSPSVLGTGDYQAANPSRSPVTINTADPHHQRASSLGEMHQQLESEQEAQVVGRPKRTWEACLANMRRTGCCK